MTSTGQDFEMYAGETKSVGITITGLASVAGLEAEWALYRGQAKVTKTHEDGISLSDLGETIMATVTLLPADTASLAAGKYTHQLTLVDADDDCAVVAEGVVTIKAKVTTL